MKPVAILGSGPAGLMAAQAVVLAGRPVVILSVPEKSRLGGAQFLHRPIPGITDDHDTTITYRVWGSEEDYRRKVYGNEYVPFTSFSSVVDGWTQEAWNLASTYERLWEVFGDKITAVQLSAETLGDMLDDFDLVFSTVPAPVLCLSRASLIPAVHRFKVQDIYVNTEPFMNMDDDTVIYNGLTNHRWYRASKLFGQCGTEWSDGSQPPLPGLIRDRKPISTNCDCWDGKVIRLGRRGTWTKGVLTHDAFYEAIKWFM